MVLLQRSLSIYLLQYFVLYFRLAVSVDSRTQPQDFAWASSNMY